MGDEKILERIRKLLAMANDERGNDNERETALRQAHSLLTKHGLDLLDVDTHERNKLDPRIRFDCESWSMAWTREIRNTIAKLFMCRYLYGRKLSGTKQMHYFVGRESNAITAAYMSAYVIENILKEARSRYKHNLSPETRAFALGCAARLRIRVRAMVESKQEEVAAGAGTAVALIGLIKAEELANEEFIAANWSVKESRARNLSMVDTRAYQAGNSYANDINLSVQVARPDEQKLLK